MDKFILALLLAGCATSAAAPAAVNEKIRCRGPEDAGRVAFWDGAGDPFRIRTQFEDVRYICKDHGPERHGYWFEAVGR